MHNNYTVQHYTTFPTGFIWFYFRDWPVLGFVVVWWDGVYDDPKDPKGPFDARNRGRLWWLRPSLSLLTHCFWTGFSHFRAWVSTVTSWLRFCSQISMISSFPHNCVDKSHEICGGMPQLWPAQIGVYTVWYTQNYFWVFHKLVGSMYCFF